jgi:peptidoglycan hydrolase-like protein with peptidoglycan-binding domain
VELYGSVYFTYVLQGSLLGHVAEHGTAMTTGSRSRVVTAALALGTPLLIGTVLAVWALADSPLQSTASAKPLFGTVEAANRTDSELTSVKLIPARSYPVVSQSTGTVTGLSITAGKALVAGKAALAVDGRPVVAYVSRSPLYRDITKGLDGDDVKTAQQLLVDLGYLDTVDGHVGTTTTSAIRVFNGAHGYGKQNGTLAIGALLWVPRGSGAPLSVKIRIGQTVARQTELYTTTSSKDRVKVTTQETSVDRLLTVGSATAVLRAGRTSVTDPADVKTIRAALGDGTNTSATLEPLTPRAVGTVPASAVVVGADGVACFFVDVHGSGTQIKADQGSFGLVDVDASLIGSPVLINPRSTREDLACVS